MSRCCLLVFQGFWEVHVSSYLGHIVGMEGTADKSTFSLLLLSSENLEGRYLDKPFQIIVILLQLYIYYRLTYVSH